jgi:type IV/VI secretion system ImpK/VasF family protein
MKNDQWEAIHSVFEKMKHVSARIASQNEEDGQEVKSSPMEKNELVRMRADIRKQLDLLRVKLLEGLSERDCYLVIFPIVSFFDERIQVGILNEDGPMNWPPLQRELFQIDDAGEVFFETLDDILRKPQTLPYCYEVFYFCLSCGFLGKYGDNPATIRNYMEKLREKIPVNPMRGEAVRSDRPAPFRRAAQTVWRPYAAVAAILAVVFIFLYGSVNYWHFSFLSFQ